MVSIRSRVLAVAIAMAFAGTTTARAEDGAATEALLKEAKFDYKVLKPGIFRVVFETPEGTSVIIVEESKMGWKDSKGNEVLCITALTMCYTTPADYKPSSALLTWVCETNDRLKFGSIASYKEKDGSTRFYRIASMFAKNAESEQFSNLIAICHYQRFPIAKQLQALVEATK